MRSFFLIAMALITAVSAFVQAAAAEEIQAKQVRYAFKDYSSSPDSRNCTFATYISNSPAPEMVAIQFRVDASHSKNVMFFSITTDVAEQLYLNGKPSSIRPIPIDQAEFQSQGFDSLGRLHATIDDGGVQLSTNDTAMFSTLLLNFQSGHFTIRFRRQGGNSIRAYNVASSMDDTIATSTRFGDCVKKILVDFDLQ
jgi:hypothetical protein